MRNVDRTVRDLQGQIERRDKQNAHLTDDAARLRDKVDKLLRNIDELQASESGLQLTARRAERELREEKDRALRLERELEGWKNLRMEKASAGSVLGSVAGSILGTGMGSVRRVGTWRSGMAGSEADEAASMVEIPKRKSSIGRAPSLTKGFL